MDFYYPDFSAANAWKQKTQQVISEANEIVVQKAALLDIIQALKKALAEIKPDHPLLIKENRGKIYDARIKAGLPRP